MSVRQHYMTICTRGADIEMTYMNRGSYVEIAFEQATNNGFNTLVLTHTGSILSSYGFNASDIDFLMRFAAKGIPVILDEIRGV